MSKAVAELASIRAKLASAIDQLAALPSSLLPVEDAIARAEQWVDEQAAQFNAGGMVATFCTPAARPDQFDVSSLARGGVHAVAEIGPYFCWAIGDVIKDKLNSAIKAHPPINPGPPAKDRPAIKARLEAEIERLERLEEIAVRDAEAAAEPVARRGDARPEIVLLPDSILR